MAIGGLDPTGGAGLTRDLATAEALGASAVLIGTAWTDQSTRGVRGFEPRSAAVVRDAVRRAVSEATSVKIGMVATPALAEAIVEALAGFAGPVVFDPVLAASSGGGLFEGQPRQLLPLLRRATVTTPNLAEASALAGGPVASLEEARVAAAALLAEGAPAVLIKGGHLPDDAIDLLVTGWGEALFTAPRLPGPSPRGTGCALATALAVELALGRALPDAVATAKRWLHERIRRARLVGGQHLL